MCFERKFSNPSSIRTLNRNKLKADIIVGDLHAKQRLKYADGLIDFEPKVKILNRNTWAANEKET